MIGQELLTTSLYGMIQSNNFPRTLLLEGPWGCGKHTLAGELASKLSLSVIDITERLNLETLEAIQLSPTPAVYLIDATNISIKEQNTILKFLEEPLKTSYIIVLCESRHKLLNTVLNRCFVKTFEGYTKPELAMFWEDSDIQNHPVAAFASTPGRVLQIRGTDATKVWDMTNKILQKVSVATYANVLSIPDKFYYKERNDDKLDFNLFTYLLSHAALENYRCGQISFVIYKMVDDFVNDLTIPNINKQILFERFLILLKRSISGEVY